MPQQPSTAESYHEATKYSEASLARDARQLDWAKQPPPFKDFVTNQRIRLAQYLPFRPTPFDVKGSEEEVPLDPRSDLGRLARVLYFTNGVTAILQHDGGRHALRAAPSAGALYPTETYLACRNTNGLEDGIYNYQAPDHSLVMALEGDFLAELSTYCFDHPALANTDHVLILTGMHQRSTWRYGERGYRRILLDTGHVLGNLMSYAPEEDFAPQLIAAFHDQALNGLLFLDDEEEAILQVVALPRTGTEPAAPQTNPLRIACHTDPDPSKEPAATMVELLHSGRFDETNSEWAPATPPHGKADPLYADSVAVPLPEPQVVWRGVAETILRRRSTRQFAGEAISRDQLSLLLWHAYAPFREPEDFGRLCAPSLLRTYVVANHVDDLIAGAYYYAPEQNELRTVRLGALEAEVWHACLGQELGRDASAVVIHTADLPAAVTTYGDRAYRYLHLDAGHLGQYMNLAAVGAGLGASGIGGFFDDEVNHLLGLPADHIAVYLTTLGQPA